MYFKLKNMTTLTNYQKDFLLQYFFKDERYAGWYNIAYALITNGECIVAGDECIWKGGIGNFIECIPHPDAYKCSIYKFDLYSFLKSNWYIETRNEVLKKYTEDIKEIEVKLADANKAHLDICNLN